MIYGILVLYLFEGNLINNKNIGVLIKRSKVLLFFYNIVDI